MRKYILGLIFFSFLLVISCTSNINNVGKLEQNKTYTLKVSDNGVNIKTKIKFNSFNLKQYKARKNLKSIKSIKVELITIANFSPFTIGSIINTLNFDVDNIQENFDLEIKGLNSGATYGLQVTCYDVNVSSQTTANIINNNGEFTLSNEFIEINTLSSYNFLDSSGNTIPSPTNYLTVSVNLQNFVPDTNEFEVYTVSGTNTIKDMKMKLNNLGNGLISWIENNGSSDQVCLKKVNEYIPEIANDCRTGFANPVSSLSLNLDSIGNGNLLFLTNGNVQGLPINNYLVGAVTNYVDLSDNIETFNSYTNENGNGLIVYSKNHPSGNKAIYAHKLENYNSFNPNIEGTLFYYDNNIVQNPQVFVNSKGNGMISWEESSDGISDFSVSTIKVENYNPPLIDGVGIIDLVVGQNIINGIGTEFTKQFYIGSKIKLGSDIYKISNIISNNQMTITNNASSNYTNVTYKGLAINKKSSETYSGSIGSSILSSSYIEDFINPGLKLIIEQNNQKVTVFGNIESTTFSLVETLNSNVNSYLYTKEAYSLNLPNNYFHRIPSIELNESGNGVIAWKVYEPSTNPDRQDFISYQRILGFEIVDINEDYYYEYSTNNIDLTSPSYNSLFPNDLSPVSIRLNSQGDGYFLFSAKENFEGETIYQLKFVNYAIDSSISNLFTKNGRISSQLNLNQVHAGLALSLSSDRKTIYGIHITKTIPSI